VSEPVRSSAYFIKPLEGERHPGVLVLHSWWGQTPFIRRFCDRLADEGYMALAPDLFDGALPDSPDSAEALLAGLDSTRARYRVLEWASKLQSFSGGPIGVVGFSMGASFALLLAARLPQTVAAAVAFYGTQSIDFEQARCAFQGHFAEFDALVSDDDVVELEAHLHLVGRPVEFHRYPGTSHWFFEADPVLAHDPVAAELAWTRTIDFLGRTLGSAAGREPGPEFSA